MTYAQRRGTILVAASGNIGAPEVSLPAGYPGVIAVGATAPDDRRASYSSCGSDLDFVAPGGDFGDVNGDHVQDGLFVLSIKPHRSEGSLANPDSFGVFVQFGTSRRPAVAGAVALLRSMGMRDQGAIEQTLRATAVNRFQTTPAFDPMVGSGLVQIDRGGAPPHRRARRLLRSRPAGPDLSANPTRGSARIAYSMSSAGRCGYGSSTREARS